MLTREGLWRDDKRRRVRAGEKCTSRELIDISGNRHLLQKTWEDFFSQMQGMSLDDYAWDFFRQIENFYKSVKLADPGFSPTRKTGGRKACGRKKENPMMDDAIANYSSSYGRPGFNSFPFGEPCDEWLPVWVGQCKGRDYKKTLENGALWEQNTDHMKHRVAFILTDRWNPSFQREVEETFLSGYAKENLRVFILLYNDYGIANVPFIMNYEMESRSKWAPMGNVLY